MKINKSVMYKNIKTCVHNGCLREGQGNGQLI